MHIKNNKIDFLFVGHYTHDTLINSKNNTSTQRLGGGVAYASIVATAFKKKFKVISKVGNDFFYGEQCQQSPMVLTHKKTTSFINYTTEIPRRHQVNVCCEPIYPMDIQDTCHIALVCGVIGEILPETIQKLHEKSDILIGDIQGMIRQIDSTGDVTHIHLDKTKYKDVLSLFDYLKVSDEELPYINISLLRKNMTLLGTYGDNGCTVFQKEHQFHIPGCPVKTVDSTGAGDSFLTGFAVGLLKNLSLKEAVCLGCCCGRVAVQSIGPAMLDAFNNSAYLCSKSCNQCVLKNPLHYGSSAESVGHRWFI